MFKTILVTFSLAIAIAVTGAMAKPAGARQEQVVPIEVTSAGFVPSQVRAQANQPTRLVVTRKSNRTCAKEIVLRDFGVDKPLPLNQPVEIAFTPTKPGQIRYACGMNMIAGVIIVE